MLSAAFVATIVGVMEVAPNTCQVNLFNPDKTVHTFEVDCSYVVDERFTIPYRAPYGP